MAACASVGVIGKNGYRLSPTTRVDETNGRNNRVKITCSSASVMDPYRTRRIEQGVTKSDVKKVFRRLAPQFHPDVCRGSNCGFQFHVINEAYDAIAVIN